MSWAAEFTVCSHLPCHLFSRVECSCMFLLKKKKMTIISWYKVLSCSQLPAKVSRFHLCLVFPSLRGFLCLRYFISFYLGIALWNSVHSRYEWAFCKNTEPLEWLCYSWCGKAEESSVSRQYDMNAVPYREYVLRLSIWVWEGAFMGSFSMVFTRGSPTLKLFSSEYGF